MKITELIPASRLDAMQAQIREFAAGFGIKDMKTSGWLPNTRRAIAIAEFAREKGKLEEFRETAMVAYWRNGKNLEDDKDLRGISRKSGLDPAAALKAADDPVYLGRVDDLISEAVEMRVTGIPTFFIGDFRIVGCQPYEVIAGAARKAGGKK